MGHLIYGNTRVILDFEDRALSHLQVVVGSKLRRRESFFFTWNNGIDQGSGRDSIWIDGAIPLRFLYTSNARAKLNHEWLELLSRTANSPTGLLFTSEPTDP